MDLLPCEILQKIAHGLLPRYQCRLALASMYYYQCLYNDLLKWHAQKDAISVPKYEYIDDKFVIIQRNNRLISYVINKPGLYYYDYTKATSCVKYWPAEDDRFSWINNYNLSILVITNIYRHVGIFRIFDRYYSYLHPKVKFVHLSLCNRLLSLICHNTNIMKNITDNLNRTDKKIFYKSGRFIAKSYKDIHY